MNRLSIAVMVFAVLLGSCVEAQTSSLLRAAPPSPPRQQSAPRAAFPVDPSSNQAMTLDAPANTGSTAQVAQLPPGYGGPGGSSQSMMPPGYQSPGPPAAGAPYAARPNTAPGATAPGTRPLGTRPLGARGAATAGVPAAPGAATTAAAPPLTIAQASWTYRPPPPLRVFNKNDVITIRVDEITRVAAEGAAESRKRTLYEAILTDWIRLDGFRLRPDPQTEGDPTYGTESNANYRAESTVESRESLTFNIAATIVDIRPNGILVLEGTKSIRVNDNLWETSLMAMCRAQDVAADNVILSKDLIDLQIQKQDRGHLRDGYKRGWFQRWFDRVKPF